MARAIGIRHRTKKSKKGEELPTLVLIKEGDFEVEYLLKTEQDELDFVHGVFPSAWRVAKEGEDLSKFRKHHIRRQEKRQGNETTVTIRVPASYDGFRAWDIIGMVLGGSGDYFAAALSRRAELVGSGRVLRIPPNKLKQEREEADKKKDHELLRRLVAEKPELFYPVMLRDRNSIRVRESYKERMEAQQARIAAENRLRSRSVGQIFLSEEGLYPEGTIADEFKARKTNDMVVKALTIEEKGTNKSLREAIARLGVWHEILEPIEGMGEAIAGGILSAVGDIRRFPKASKLVAYLGAHVLPDGSFPRKRRGQVANWDDVGRQSLYLFGDQCVYQADGKWGKYLRAAKIRYRRRHPVFVDDAGKKHYSDIHVHKTAIWRTLTRFTEALWRDWTKLEQQGAASKKTEHKEAA